MPIMMFRKSYKRKSVKDGMNKRGQTAMYVIIAIVIVVAGVMVYTFYPEITSGLGGEITPAAFLRQCMGLVVSDNVELIASQGGYANPEGFVNYKNVRVKYLCYESQYYTPCKVQQPLLRQQFEKDLEVKLAPEVESCVDELKAEYERRGYQVNALGTGSEVNIIPESIKIKLKSEISVTKDETQSFKGVEINI